MDYNNPQTPPPGGYGYQPPNNPMDDVTRGKTVAVLSYCLLIGWIIGIALHQNDKTKFGAFHLRQGLGLMIFWIGAAIAFFVLGWVLWGLWLFIGLVHLTGFVFAILGIINAANGKTTQLPLIGKFSEKMLEAIQ